jgi:hypothetical protein
MWMLVYLGAQQGQQQQQQQHTAGSMLLRPINDSHEVAALMLVRSCWCPWMTWHNRPRGAAWVTG